jgi:hypothetical protein
MIRIAQEKEVLLDTILKDLVEEKFSILSILEKYDLFTRLSEDRVILVEFAQEGLLILQREYPSLPLSEVFISIVVDVCGQLDTWIEIPTLKWNKMIKELRLSLDDIEIRILESNTQDYELMLALMEDELL